MLRRDLSQNNPVAAVVFASFDLVQPRVSPVQFLGVVVQGEGVRHSDVRDDDGRFAETRQVGSFDAGRVGVPVGPEYPAAAAVDGDASRLVLATQFEYRFDGAGVGHAVRQIDAVYGGVVVARPV